MTLERAQVQAPTLVAFADFVANVAQKAGLKIQVKAPDLIVVPYEMGEGRLQNTFVRPLGTTGAGHAIIGFFSPCMRVEAGQQLDAATANDLLRKNARIPHGAWAIASVDGQEYLGVQDTQIAQTMQPEEFAASCVVVAKLADDMEKQLGKDVF